MFRMFASVNDIESTGVALPVANRIVDQRGGMTNLMSDAGNGTTLVFLTTSCVPGRNEIDGLTKTGSVIGETKCRY